MSDQPNHLYKTPVSILSIDETIEKAVNVMVNRQVGSVLVKDKKGQLAGIFTERDLLNNFLKLLKANGSDKTLRTVMNSPVISVSPEDISLAPQIMSTHGIRHLPVVKGRDKETTVLGILSMRDVLQTLTESHPSRLKLLFGGGKISTVAESLLPLDIALFFPSSSIKNLIESVFQKVCQLTLHEVTASAYQATGFTPQSVPKLIIVECSEQPMLWQDTILRLQEDYPSCFFILIIETPTLTADDLRVIQKLARKQNVEIYDKPVNVVKLLISVSNFVA